MTHTTLSRTAGILATGGLVMAAIAAPSAALASQPTGHRVTICHATSSDTNPYVRVTVDVASSGHLQGGHDTQHTGPVWNATLKDQHVSWGDIIPVYVYGDFAFAGKNLEDGLVTWLNDCQVPAADSASARVDATPSGSPAEESTPTDGVPSDALPTDGVPSDALPTDGVPSDALPTDGDPTDGVPTDPTPTEEPSSSVAPTEEPSSSVAPTEEPSSSVAPTDGEISIDGPFVTPTPAATPVGQVLGATGTPEVTPPSTDTIGVDATSAPAGLQMLLLAVTGLSILVLIVGRVPAARRS